VQKCVEVEFENQVGVGRVAQVAVDAGDRVGEAREKVRILGEILVDVAEDLAGELREIDGLAAGLVEYAENRGFVAAANRVEELGN
jgi:hypothetical protein